MDKNKLLELVKKLTKTSDNISIVDDSDEDNNNIIIRVDYKINFNIENVEDIHLELEIYKDKTIEDFDINMYIYLDGDKLHTLDELIYNLKDYNFTNEEITKLKELYDLWAKHLNLIVNAIKNWYEYYEKFYSKINKNIAKEIREVLKTVFWKEYKFSVTTKDNSIYISIMEGTIDFFTKKYKQAEENKNWDLIQELRREWQKYMPKWKAILDIVEGIWNLYNFDNSEPITDYFHVNYYGSVEIGKWNNEYQIKNK